MIPATRAVQRPADAKLLVIDAEGHLRHRLRRELTDLLRRGDLVVANDAATLPASLPGEHMRTGNPIEVRLASRRSLSTSDVSMFSAVVFGAGDFRTLTEHRPPPPALAPGDRLALGPLSAIIVDVLGHPRLISLRFDGTSDEIWAGLARHGHAIQYAHLADPLALWDVWTMLAGPPVAFEPPSAGFVLDWHTIEALRSRGIAFRTLTHAAGISSTGDVELDKLLPFDEPYFVPPATASAITAARAAGARIVAVGTTVVRALEHAARTDGTVRAGHGTATQRIDAASQLRVADVVLTGVHERGTSHYELLRAFACDQLLTRADDEMDTLGYRTHEFGDSVLIERMPRGIFTGWVSPN